MSDKTIFDVLDTAVKIGLGALISGISTYWITRKKEKSDAAREYEKRHRAILEQVAEEIEQVNHVFLKYWSLVDLWIRWEKNGIAWPDDRDKDFEKTKKELFNIFKNVTSAEAKLFLINEKKASEILREYGESIVSFRRNYYIGNKSISEEKIAIDKALIKDIRERLFEIISSSYKK